MIYIEANKENIIINVVCFDYDFLNFIKPKDLINCRANIIDNTFLAIYDLDTVYKVDNAKLQEYVLNLIEEANAIKSKEITCY